MQFTTKIPIPKSDFTIDYSSKIISMGSCFAENIGEKFEYYKFQSSMNPFGIIFNPVSIEKLIIRALKKDYFTENDIFFYNERWNCYEVHSELSLTEKEQFLELLNQRIDEFYERLLNASHLILTLGTSWVYRSVQTEEIVANCHKVPQKEFTKELLSVEVISRSLQSVVDEILKVNNNIKFIFTVSPVRHIKDGFVENQLSKAHLISTVHDFLADSPLAASYFPSYEIMMDELRDYRFYADDMLHPSSVAIDYIWQRFKETSISESAYKTMEEVSIVQKGLAHRSFNPNSESHLKFLANLRDKMNRLQEQFSFMRFNV